MHTAVTTGRRDSSGALFDTTTASRAGAAATTTPRRFSRGSWPIPSPGLSTARDVRGRFAVHAGAWASLVVFASAAHAEVPEATTTTAEARAVTAEPSELGTDHGLSARALAGAVAVPGLGGSPLWGGGLAFEQDVAHGAIAIEVAVEAMWSADGGAALAELVVEKPIELGETVGLYVGGGPTAVLHVFGERVVPGWGGLALVGVEVVVIDDWEVFVELDAAALFADARIALEADVGTGVMLRF
jgi:hypothetical protein